MPGTAKQEILTMASVDANGRLIWRSPQLLTWIMAFPGVYFLLDMRDA